MLKASGVAHACQVVRRVIPFLGARPDGRFAYVIPAGRYQVSHMEPRHYLTHIDPALALDGTTPRRAGYPGARPNSSQTFRPA
jgi:hypothetical protein